MATNRGSLGSFQGVSLFIFVVFCKESRNDQSQSNLMTSNGIQTQSSNNKIEKTFKSGENTGENYTRFKDLRTI